VMLIGGGVVAVVLDGGKDWGGTEVLDSACWGLESCSTTPCISVPADRSSSDWFFFLLLLLPDLDSSETGAVVEPATEVVGALGGLVLGGLGGSVLPLFFDFFRGQEEESCPTILQVRQVFGARGHQASTFTPRTSKMVVGASVFEGSISRTRSHRRVNQALPGMRCGAISLTLPNCSQWRRSIVSKDTAEAIGTLANFTSTKRGRLAEEGMGGRASWFVIGRGLDRRSLCSSSVWTSTSRMFISARQWSPRIPGGRA